MFVFVFVVEKCTCHEAVLKFSSREEACPQGLMSEKLVYVPVSLQLEEVLRWPDTLPSGI